MERQSRSGFLRRIPYLVGGLILLVGIVALLEMVFPRSPRGDGDGLPPIVPGLERVGERRILIDAGFIDRVDLVFDEEDSVEAVDEIYRCLELRLDEAFGPRSDPQGDTRWSRRLEVGRRLREVQKLCVPGRGGPP